MIHNTIRVYYWKGALLSNGNRIPIKYRGGNEYIEVECKIYSVDNSYFRIFDFVIDTGATISGISESVAIQLGYDPSDPYYIVDFDTAGGIEEKLPIIELSRIDVHHLNLEKPKVLCNKHFDEINIHGVLGLDFLTYYNLYINFDENFMEINERKIKVITP